MDRTSAFLPSYELTGKVALVTGAARGIGRAIALACAAAGADIALGLSEEASGGELAAEIARMGRKALPLQLDVTRMDQIGQAVERVLATFGRIDVLVNNVGVGPENPAEKVTEEDFDFTLNANLKGTFFVTQAA
jgi:NAD(P)-dependent dehydrogenase (short-subunit alcohol dehydrogenase family)